MLKMGTGVESKHKQDILRNAEGKTMKTKIEEVPCDRKSNAHAIRPWKHLTDATRELNIDKD